MRFLYYGVAVVATVLAGLLWMFIIGQLRAAPSVPVAVESAAVPVASPGAGRLPVVPVVRLAGSGYGVGDAVYDAQVAEYRAGRLSCVSGVLARRVERDGVAVYVAVQTDRGALVCP